MSIVFRPLGKVREIVQAIGFDISYAYDDLVFSDHSLFILQFDDTILQKINLFFNSDCIETEVDRVKQLLITEASIAGFEIDAKGTFSLNQREGAEELEVRFN
jgi:hypothetical protein